MFHQQVLDLNTGMQEKVPFFVASTLLRVQMSEAGGYADSPNTEHIWNSSNWGLHYRGVSVLAL